VENPVAGEKKKVALLSVSIIFLVFLIYSNILNAPFVFDDSTTVVHNATIKNLKTAFFDLANNRYVGFLSFAVNYAFGGLKPYGYHVVNIALHAINSLLIYYLVKLTFRTPILTGQYARSEFIAIGTALLFAVHPIQTQAVTYVAQRVAVLATTFYIVSIIFYAKARLLLINRGLFISGRHIFYYITAILASLLALKTKQIAVTLPVAIALYEMYFFRAEDSRKQRALYMAPFFLTLLVIPLSSMLFAGAHSIEELAGQLDSFTRDDRVTHSRLEYLYTQFSVILTYLRLLFFPVRQLFDYDFPVYRAFMSPDVLLPFLVIVSLIIAGILMFNRNRLASFGVIWFFLALSIESSIIPIRDVLVEHRVYLPSIGFFLFVMTLWDRFAPDKKLKISALALLALALSAGAFVRNNTWKSPEYLWHDVMEKAPHNARAYGSLGIIYKERKEYDKALEMFEKTKTLGKAYPEVFLHLGDIYYEKGAYEKALTHLKVAEEIDYAYKIRLSVLNKLGRTYERLGNTDRAIYKFGEAIKLYPKSTSPYNNLGVIYIRQKKYDMAIETLQAGLRNYEADYLYKNLIEAYRRKGDTEKATSTQKQYISFMLKMKLARTIQ
jgi:tetratricopeptide (TPR) repeat protein